MGTKAARKTKLKTIGVLGGMGPEATAYFFGLIARNTRVSRDQDHIPVVVCSLPQVPDRTEAILHGGPSPLPLLIRGVEALRRAGADFAVMPCVTAHYFHAALAARSPLPVVNLLDETVSEVGGVIPGSTGSASSPRPEPSDRGSSMTPSGRPASRSSSPTPAPRERS